MTDFSLECSGLVIQTLKEEIDISKYNIYINTLILGEEYEDIEIFDFDQSMMSWEYFLAAEGTEFSARGLVNVELDEDEEETLDPIKSGEPAPCSAELELRLDGDSPALQEGVDFIFKNKGSWLLLS